MQLTIDWPQLAGVGKVEGRFGGMGGLWSQDTILSSILIAVSCGMGANQLLIFQGLARDTRVRVER